MAISTAKRTGRSVDVVCGQCGGVFALSVRREYEYRRRGQDPVCTTCRRPPIEMTAEERERYRRWWIESSGLSRRELHAIAVGLGSIEPGGWHPWHTWPRIGVESSATGHKPMCPASPEGPGVEVGVGLFPSARARR